ncbi:hypothetical protein RvY_00836 [Ramazzottius varieornatus]|uniref:Tectonic domain-containing protein n=1 Tax=Ramazzottius varieornatus TaxID=947166 RepID=A0A1D1UNY6_RAMVA|nr:hypothetical protein RvY_00836 [Ramazzottius varieornatus]
MASSLFPTLCFVTLLVCGLADAGLWSVLKDLLGFAPDTAGSSEICVPKSSNLPNFFRVEAEIRELKNPSGVQSNGSPCDIGGKCDPIVYAYVDLIKPTSPFPGTLAVESMPKVFAVDGTNNPSISTVVSADLCGQTLIKATLRVQIMDHNALLTDSLISNFDCYIGGDVPDSVQQAEWSPVETCVSKFQSDKLTLTFRSRMYRISQQDCRDSRMMFPTTTAGSIFNSINFGNFGNFG